MSDQRATASHHAIIDKCYLVRQWMRGVSWVAKYSPDTIVISLTKPSWQVSLLCQLLYIYRPRIEIGCRRYFTFAEITWEANSLTRWRRGRYCAKIIESRLVLCLGWNVRLIVSLIDIVYTLDRLNVSYNHSQNGTTMARQVSNLHKNILSAASTN